MKIDRNKVKVLIDRYMNGETTADEERQLRHFFRTAQSLPDEWLPLRALFAYVDSEAEKSCLPAETQVKQKTISLHHIRKWWLAGAVAASLLLATGLFWPDEKEDRNFAVIDGQRTTNQHIVEQEAEQALQLVAITDEEAFGALNEIN